MKCVKEAKLGKDAATKTNSQIAKSADLDAEIKEQWLKIKESIKNDKW